MAILILMAFLHYSGTHIPAGAWGAVIGWEMVDLFFRFRRDLRQARVNRMVEGVEAVLVDWGKKHGVPQ